MVRFYIVRHGQSVLNLEKRFSGQYDAALSELGYAQAECVSKYILENFRIDMIVSSDLRRAFNTVKPVAEALGMPIETYKELREVDVGRWHLVPYADIRNVDPEGYAEFNSKKISERVYGGGESYFDVRKRAVGKLREIARDNDGKNILIGTHAGVVRVLCLECLGMSVDDMDKVSGITNASVTTIDYENGVFTLVEAGYKKHMQDASLIKE